MGVDDCYQLGNVVRTHGLQGGLVFHLDTDNPLHYKDLESVFIELDGKLIPFFIHSIAVRGTQAITQLEDVNDVDVASQLVGKLIYLPLDRLPKLPKDQFYYHDLIGFEVFNEGKLLGKVTDVYDAPNNYLMSVEHQGKEVLIPMSDHIILEVNLESGKIITQLPDGLIDVYLDQ